MQELEDKILYTTSRKLVVYGDTASGELTIHWDVGMGPGNSQNT